LKIFLEDGLAATMNGIMSGALVRAGLIFSVYMAA
jgi:hypothetical protein